MEQVSPPIDDFAWGRVDAAGASFKDAKLFPGGARVWDWNETGTRHIPGIQRSDVGELVDAGADIIVLSRGVWKRLRTRRDTLEYLRAKGIEVEVLQTEDAVVRYNDLASARRVGALIHSTC